MNKEKFLESLRKKLSILEESEIEDIITEYEGYIEEKIKKGSSEEEAVASMGNVDELARELLSAYKIKDPNEKNHDGINNLVDSFINIFDRIISVFAHKSFHEIVKFIIELVCIFLIIAICKIPFEIIEGMGRGIFSSLGSNAYHVLFGIWNFILEFAYLIFAVLLFIKIFESRYLNEESVSIFKEESEKKERKSTHEEKREKVVEEKRTIRKEENPRNFGIVDALAKICILFIKFILLFILFGVVCYVIGMSLALGVSVYLLIRGVFYFGIYIILLALFALGIVAFIFLFNFIFDHKNKMGFLLITTLVSFVLLGVGTGVCALEFANTTILYTEENENLHNEEYIFDMKDNLILSHYYGEQDIIVDDTLKNQIKVVYSYNDLHFKIKANPYLKNDGKYDILRIGYRVSEFKYSKEMFNKFIEDLKNKTFIATPYDEVSIKIYVSSEVKSQLQENLKKYENSLQNRNLEDICEELEENGLELPHYCKDHHFYTAM